MRGMMQEAGEDVAAAENTSRQLKVLLVEDNPGDAVLVRIALTASGRDVHIFHAQTMAEAVDLLSGDTFDVALLDLSLPDSFGLATVGAIQSAAPNLPIVVMTGLDDPRVADEALERGAQDFLIKGDFPAHLVERAIRYAISRMNSELERRALLSRLETEQAAMAREMERARATQIALLPSRERLEAIRARKGICIESLFEPSLGIGGDMWGCLELEDGRLAFYGFDFSGHGISAALNVFRLHTLINDHHELAGEPGAMLTHLNASLTLLLERGQYATMFYGVLDGRSGELSWAAAGAPRPMLIAGRVIRLIDTTGLPLGITRQAVYDVRRTLFPRQSSLLFISDALTEAEDGHGTMLGEEGVEELLRKGLPDNGPGRLSRFMGRAFDCVGRPLADDLTAVWISRE